MASCRASVVLLCRLCLRLRRARPRPSRRPRPRLGHGCWVVRFPSPCPPNPLRS